MTDSRTRPACLASSASHCSRGSFVTCAAYPVLAEGRLSWARGPGRHWRRNRPAGPR